jgi:hypothetical protein
MMISIHKRASTTKHIGPRRDIETEYFLNSMKFPTIETTRADVISRSTHTSQLKNYRKIHFSNSPIKNISFLVKRCETELQKIRKISVKLKKSTRKVKHNQFIIDKIIYKPLYSIKLLSEERPKFLNKKLKYE